jgi:type I restriction enzyme S subunit
MNVLDGRFDSTDLAHITEEQADRLANVVVEQDDVLLNITGASVARCCLVPAHVLPARVNQHVAIVRLDRSAAVPRFVQGYLVSPLGKSRLLGLAQGGATREALTKATIEGFSIPLPELTIQKRIAEILGAIDALIENNRRRIALLEQMALAIYREWFVQFRTTES